MDTKTRILDAAEAVFAERGISQTSLRSVVAKAGVNVAAVHYHFGSKEELLRALFSRRVGSVNDSRLKQLKLLREKYKDSAIPVKEILRAFFGPALEMAKSESEEKKNFLRCMARAQSETDEMVQMALLSSFRQVIEEFNVEIKRSCPVPNQKEQAMRFSFMVGAMVHTILLPLKPLFIQKFFEKGFPEDELLEMLVAFCSAGLAAQGSLCCEANENE